MKKTVRAHVIKAAFTACILSLVATGDLQAATLEQTVKDAVGFNPQLRIEQLDRKISAEDLRESRSGFFPTLSATAEGGRVSQENDTTRGLTTDQSGAASYVGEGYIALKQLIFDGRQTYNRYKAAGQRKLARDYDYNAAVSDIARQSVSVHIDVARLRGLVDETQDFLNAVAEYRDKMALMVDEGALGRSELLQADELIMLTRNALLNYQEQLVLAETLYEEIVGHLPPPDLMMSATPIAPFLPENLEEALQRGRTEHPALKALTHVSKALKRDLRAEKGAIIPRFDAELSFRDRSQAVEIGGQAEGAMALVKMSWDMSLGGAYGARVDRSLALQKQALAERDKLMNFIERDIKQRYAELIMSGKQLDILFAREKANNDIFKSYNAEYEAGSRTILEIVNAQNRLFDATVSRLNGEYEYIAAKYDLLGAMGQIQEVFGYVPEKEQSAEEQTAAKK